jgi:hypothetical protein
MYFPSRERVIYYMSRYFSNDGWEKAARRQARLDRWVDNTRKRREKAVLALGGSCMGCGETDQERLRITAIPKEARGWGRSKLHAEILERVSSGRDPKELAILKCGQCWRTELTEAAVRHNLEKMEQLKKPGTGIFYWVGGQKVEQMRRGGKIIIADGIVTSWRAMEHYDLGIDQLYKRD